MKKLNEKRYILIILSLIIIIYYILRSNLFPLEEMFLRGAFSLIFIMYLFLIIRFSEDYKIFIKAFPLVGVLMFMLLYTFEINMSDNSSSKEYVVSEEFNLNKDMYNVYYDLNKGNEGIVENFESKNEQFYENDTKEFLYNEFDSKVLNNIINYMDIDTSKVDFDLQDKIEHLGSTYYILRTIEDFYHDGQLISNDNANYYYGGITFTLIKVSQTGDVEGDVEMDFQGYIPQKVRFIESDDKDKMYYYSNVIWLSGNFQESATYFNSINNDMSFNRHEFFEEPEYGIVKILQAKIYDNSIYILNYQNFDGKRELYKYDIEGNLVKGFEAEDSTMLNFYSDFDIENDKIYTYTASIYYDNKASYVYSVHVYDLDFKFKNNIVFKLPKSQEFSVYGDYNFSGNQILGDSFSVKKVKDKYLIKAEDAEILIKVDKNKMYYDVHDGVFIVDSYFNVEGSAFENVKVHKYYIITLMIIFLYSIAFMDWRINKTNVKDEMRGSI